MADISDVENALCGLIDQVVYPGGVANGSVTGSVIKIYRGWPSNRSLNADLAAGSDTVTVFSREHSTRDTSRYARVWRTQSVQAPTLALSVNGNMATLSGLCGPGQTVGLIVDGIAYAWPVSVDDSLLSVIAGLAGEIPLATASGPVITLATTRVSGRVVGSGTSIMETRRQEQGVMISVWSATPAARDLLSAAIDGSLAGIDWLPLADGTSARLTYRETFETDISENANLYRRNLDYRIEYATTVTMSGAQMGFAVGTLNAGGPITGFGCLVPPARLVVPPLGAVRFDAWYDPSNSIDSQCAAALSPSAYNFRLPANAVIDDAGATWPLATQATIDAEIAAALQAGLSFWAFDSYQPDDTLSLALQLYLTSSLRGRLNFCMLGQTSNWGTGGQDQPSLLRDIRMMTQPGYMTVLGGRPLYLVLDASTQETAGLPAGGVAAAIAMVRQQVQLAGGGNPYVVWLSGAALADYSNVAAAQAAGADAAGAYAVPRLDGAEQAFSALADAAVQDWVARGQTGFPMVPTAMSGWDQRPLIETPQAFYPIPDSLDPGSFYDTATADAVGDQVVALATFVAGNAAVCPAQIGLVYAWNELAEGGWLMPTYTPDGPDASRCAAAGAALAAAIIQSTNPTITLIN